MKIPFPANNSEQEMQRWFSIRTRFNPVIMIPYWLILLALFAYLCHESVITAVRPMHSIDKSSIAEYCFCRTQIKASRKHWLVY